MPFTRGHKPSKPPPVPPTIKQVDISSGRRAGEEERGRLLSRRGRRRSVLAGREQLQPANIVTALLKRNLAGVG